MIGEICKRIQIILYKYNKHKTAAKYTKQFLKKIRHRVVSSSLLDYYSTVQVVWCAGVNTLTRCDKQLYRVNKYYTNHIPRRISRQILIILKYLNLYMYKDINYSMIRPKPHTATTQGYADGKVHKKYVEHTVEGI